MEGGTEVGRVREVSKVLSEEAGGILAMSFIGSGLSDFSFISTKVLRIQSDDGSKSDSSLST